MLIYIAIFSIIAFWTLIGFAYINERETQNYQTKIRLLKGDAFRIKTYPAFEYAIVKNKEFLKKNASVFMTNFETHKNLEMYLLSIKDVAAGCLFGIDFSTDELLIKNNDVVQRIPISDIDFI
jgi:hypothetical protein